MAKEDVPNFPRRACFQALMGRGRGGANRDLVGHTLTVLEVKDVEEMTLANF